MYMKTIRHTVLPFHVRFVKTTFDFTNKILFHEHTNTTLDSVDENKYLMNFINLIWTKSEPVNRLIKKEFACHSDSIVPFDCHNQRSFILNSKVRC